MFPIVTLSAVYGASSSSPSTDSLELGIVRAQLQLGQRQLRLALEKVVEPLAGRVQLEAVTRIRRDERSPPAVLLDAQLA